MPPVQLLHTCLVNEIDPDVGRAVVNVLERLGYSVEVPLEQTCCGQPALNAGFQDQARVAARHMIDVFEATEGPVIIPSGSCGDMVIHQYKSLFAADVEGGTSAPHVEGGTLVPPNAKGDEWRRRAHNLALRCEEFSAFVARHAPLTARLDTTIAYHPSCHLLRGLGVVTQPKTVLAGIEGTTLVELQAADECCGFGGLFSIKHSDISGRMLDRKIDNVVASGAQRLVSCDVGCLLHMSGGLHRKGIDMRVQHLAQVLDEASS